MLADGAQVLPDGVRRLITRSAVNCCRLRFTERQPLGIIPVGRARATLGQLVVPSKVIEACPRVPVCGDKTL